MKFFLCGESSQNGFSKRCSDLVFPRDAYIKFFKRQGIKMPSAWEDRAKEMADEEKVVNPVPQTTFTGENGL